MFSFDRKYDSDSNTVKCCAHCSQLTEDKQPLNHVFLLDKVFLLFFLSCVHCILTLNSLRLVADGVVFPSKLSVGRLSNSGC